MTHDVPVIVLTGNKDTMVRRTLINLGADEVFYKPPDFEELLSVLNRHIESSKQVQH